MVKKYDRFISLPNNNGNFQVWFYKEIQAVMFDDLFETIGLYPMDLTKDHLSLLCKFIYEITKQYIEDEEYKKEVENEQYN